jgi:hypothetical protein
MLSERSRSMHLFSVAVLLSLGSPAVSTTFYDEEGRIDVQGKVLRSSGSSGLSDLEATQHHDIKTPLDDSARKSAQRSPRLQQDGNLVNEEDEELRLRTLWNNYPTCHGDTNYIGDNYCDWDNNNEYCGFDEGDCCQGGSGRSCKDPDVVGYPNPRASDYAQSLSDSQQEWLELHNGRRSKYHRMYGEEYVPLMYSTYLEDQALSYARELSQDYCEDYHHSNGNQGENLAVIWQAKHKPARVMTAWAEFEEIKPTNVPFKNGSGHWMQVIWRSSKYVGCAHKSRDAMGKDGKLQSCIIYVCRFLSAGNCDRSNNDWLFDAMRSETNCQPKCPPNGCTHPLDTYYE